jgi:hypothetical protein
MSDIVVMMDSKPVDVEVDDEIITPQNIIAKAKRTRKVVKKVEEVKEPEPVLSSESVPVSESVSVIESFVAESKQKKPRSKKSAKSSEPVQVSEPVSVHVSVSEPVPVSEPESVPISSAKNKSVIRSKSKKNVQPLDRIEQPIEETKEPESVPISDAKQKKRGRPPADKFKSIEARIRGNEFKGADKSNLVVFISKSLAESPECRQQIIDLLRELDHKDVLMIFSML